MSNYNVLKSMEVIDRASKIGVAHIIDDTNKNNGEATWSSKNLVDRICPSFSKSGIEVSCRPVEGYPLTVKADVNATSITQCGKNLLNEDWKDWDKGWKDDPDSDKNQKFFRLKPLKPGDYCLWLERTGSVYAKLDKLVGYDEEQKEKWEQVNYFSTNTSNKPAPFTVAEGELFRIWCSGGADNASFNRITHMQIEKGKVKTTREKYQAPKTYGVNEPIPAFAGTNIFSADVGEITVIGKLDPISVIEDLSKAVAALGGNI